MPNKSSFFYGAGFRSLTREIADPVALPVEGKLPSWLKGTLLRTWLAFTETSIPVRFSPDTLETLGVFGYEFALKGQIRLPTLITMRSGRVITTTSRI